MVQVDDKRWVSINVDQLLKTANDEYIEKEGERQKIEQHNDSLRSELMELEQIVNDNISQALERSQTVIDMTKEAVD